MVSADSVRVVAAAAVVFVLCNQRHPTTIPILSETCQPCKGSRASCDVCFFFHLASGVVRATKEPDDRRDGVQAASQFAIYYCCVSV